MTSTMVIGCVVVGLVLIELARLARWTRTRVRNTDAGIPSAGVEIVRVDNSDLRVGGELFKRYLVDIAETARQQ